MNTQTLTQRRAIHAYTEARRDAIYHAERQRLESAKASQAADAACVEINPPVSLWLVALGATLWTALLVIGLVLAADKLGWLS